MSQNNQIVMTSTNLGETINKLSEKLCELLLEKLNNYKEIVIDEKIPELPKLIKNRIEGQKYTSKGEIRIWNGKNLTCQHNRRIDRCKDCGGSGICEHKRIKGFCKECGGINICVHNRSKHVCKECKGSQICEHNHIRSTCKECRGGSICIHNRTRTECKDCKGGSLCEHNKKRSHCKECEGGSICEHNRFRPTCKECGGSQICEHNKIRSVCKECGGSQICEHNRFRPTCKECGGSQICEHNKIRSVCKECKGGSICIHNKNKSTCKECGGGSICIHNKNKSRCPVCSPNSNSLCKQCKYTRIDLSVYKPYCTPCYYQLNPDQITSKRYFSKEYFIHTFLTQELSEDDVKIIHDKSVGGCSKKRPDWFVDLLTHTIVIECDERQHASYECENKRMMEIFSDLANRPMVIIRINPDKNNYEEGCFRFENNTIIPNDEIWNKRKMLLLESIRAHIKVVPDKEITCIKIGFDE